MANNSIFFHGENNGSIVSNSRQNNSIPDSLKTRVALGIDITIFVVALLGNFLVLVVIYSSRERRKTPFEILIANLSVADILSVLVHVIYNYIQIPPSKWYCKFQGGFFSSIQTASVLIMTTIAIFRCRSIIHPFKTKPSTKVTCCTVLGLWIISNVCLLPVYLVREKYHKWCKEIWPSQLLNKVYTVSLAVVQYVIPLTIIAVCYTRIVVYLKRNRGPQCGLSNMLKVNCRRDMEVIKISLIIVLLFNLFALPIQIAFIELVFFESYTNEMENVPNYTHQIFLLHCCCNPFVYGTISREFRSRFLRVLTTFCCMFKIKRTRAGVFLEGEHGRVNNAAENLEMVEIKAYVKRNEAATVEAARTDSPTVMPFSQGSEKEGETI